MSDPIYNKRWYAQNAERISAGRKERARARRLTRRCKRCPTIVGHLGPHALVCGACRAEKRRATERARYNADPERGRRVNREKRAAHPERYRAATAAWFKSHPEYANNQARRRRVAIARAHGSHTPSDWSDRLLEFGHRCAFCGHALSGRGNCTQEHMLALSRGGSDSIDNIIPSCRSCNSKKKDRGILSMINVQYGGA